MNEYNELYSPAFVKGSYFSKMINCGAKYNDWVEDALRYVPPEILWEYKEKIIFIGTGAMDACRVSPALSKDREIIILAERIFPNKGSAEDDLKVKYFIFAILHELVHAVRKHRSPLLDKLTKEEIESQEKEADDLAMAWFENYIEARNNPYLKAITREEITLAQAENQRLMEKAYDEYYKY